MSENIVDELSTALTNLLDLYVTLAGSGDCGFWEPEDEPEVIAARLALSRIKGGD